MKPRYICVAILSCALTLNLAAAKKQKREVLPYQNPALSIDERVHDLMQRMTWEEKVGQLRCTMAWNYYDIASRGKKPVVNPSESFKKDIAEGHIGMLWATYRADPWTQKSLENGLTPELAAMAGNALQKYVRENTRLGIPLFLAEEAPHGHMAIGTTVFPTGLGLAATWSPELVERVGSVIGKEIRLQGGHISYGPVLDISRDPRWSRVEESYGEDPVLTGELGAAMVRGLGGGDLAKPYSTLATLKHFIAYGTTEGGQNGNQTVLGPMELHQHFLPPFRKAIEAGALSVMTSYNSCDGIPCTSNRYLLTDVLRRQWGFRGFVVSDLFSIDGIAGMGAARDNLEAGIMALQAGVDVDLGASAYGKLQALSPNRLSPLPLPMREGSGISLQSESENGGLDRLSTPLPRREGQGGESSLIDSSCERILRLKFEMGLFDNPYVDPKAAAANVRTEADCQVALDAARASITLLKNNGILPLRVDEGLGMSDEGLGMSDEGLEMSDEAGHLSSASSVLKLLVVGPNADTQYNQLGDYTAPQPDDHITTVLESLRSRLSPLASGTLRYQRSPQLSISYVKGCAIRDTTENTIAEAIRAAEEADVVIAVVGGSSARDFKTSYKETGAAETLNTEHPSPNTQIPDMDCGEGFDRATLDLLGLQPRLLAELKKTGKPLVVVYIEGRPLDKTWAAEHADALLTAYYPGQAGGQAIADVLLGRYNPAGRLPVSVPRSVGQLPVYYNKRAPRPHDYVEQSARPLYAFGHGLSYTTFEYSDINVIKTDETDDQTSVPSVPSVFKIICSVTNTGPMDGEEVVQLYLRDDVATVVQPLQQLKAFRRVFISRGETRRVEFTLTPADLAILNPQLQPVVEPGTFTVMVGAASDDIRLRTTLTVE